jgi:hypothetical protein
MDTVVPEILEPSLQLSAAVLGSLNFTAEEINEVIGSFRRSHMAELRQLTELSGGSLGYGLSEKLEQAEVSANRVPADGVEIAATAGVIKVSPEPMPAT